MFGPAYGGAFRRQSIPASEDQTGRSWKVRLGRAQVRALASSPRNAKSPESHFVEFIDFNLVN